MFAIILYRVNFKPCTFCFVLFCFVFSFTFTLIECVRIVSFFSISLYCRPPLNNYVLSKCNQNTCNFIILVSGSKFFYWTLSSIQICCQSNYSTFILRLTNNHFNNVYFLSIPVWPKINRAFKMGCKNFLSQILIKTIWQIFQYGGSKQWVHLLSR